MVLYNPDVLPLIPERLLRRANVYESYDTRFRAAARLLQALWRERRKLPEGHHTNAAGARRRLGSRLASDAARNGANFLTPDIFGQARCDLAYREPGALVDIERMHSNLLSSMPLCFNLLAPLKLDKKLARRVFNQLAPGIAKDITHVQFEHSPGRGDVTFTGDGTAFDAFVSVRGSDGRRGFIAIETKYSETMNEPEARLRPRYDDLSRTSGLYAEPDDEALRKNPLQSLWRTHMLAQSAVDAGLFDYGVFLLIAPRQNRDVQRAARAYTKRLSNDPTKVAFLNIELEDAIDAVRKAGAPDLADALHERYTDFGPVHRLVREACLATPRRKRPLRTGPRVANTAPRRPRSTPLAATR
ncbi:MAG: PGN_0703 family putative restriction endonuclease [Terricaulis sp.]